MPNDGSIARFRAAFPGVEPTAIARAPGRVNLIGEHIDYNDGIVLPIAIDLETRVVIGPTGDGRLRVRSAGHSDELNFDVAHVPSAASRAWDAYVRGVAVLLSERGIGLSGCAIWIESDIPVGAGLSSSAAVEIALALALLAASRVELPMRDIADLCREAEHRFAGVPCGIMDQYACGLALAGQALSIDCRDQSIRHVAWPRLNPAVLIFDTGIERKLAGGAYAQRVRECGEALVEIRALDSSVAGWRDVTWDHLSAVRSRLGEVLFRRGRHIVSEIDRTMSAITALEQGAVGRLGELMYASHASLRDDYEVSLPSIDRLVELLQMTKGGYGAKLTGAGFGGCVVALVDRMAVESIRAQIESNYIENKAVVPRDYLVEPAQGASITNL